MGTLIIDGSVVATGRSQGSSSSLNTNPPIYLGSLSAEMAITADSIFEVSLIPSPLQFTLKQKHPFTYASGYPL